MKIAMALALTGLVGCGAQTVMPKGQTESLVVKGAATQAFDQGQGGQGSPTSLKLNLMGLYISASADCTNPIQVQDFGAPKAVDFYTNPTLFEGNPPDATYPCVIIKGQDILAGKVDAVAAAAFPGICDTTTEYSGDLYRAPDTDWHDLTGAPIVAHGTDTMPVADTVYFFASTDVLAAQNGSLQVSQHQLLKLLSPLVVPGAATFYADFNNGVSASGGSCNIEKGAFGFR